MPDKTITRRLALGTGAVGLGSLLAGCDKIGTDPKARNLLDSASNLNYRVQRLLLRSDDLAKEYAEKDIAPAFRANGSTNPTAAAYRRLAAKQFVDWRLTVDGLVDTPLSLSLDDLRAMPSRTQITRHDCVEGWSCIGKWTGVQLSHVLDLAKVKSDARYVVFQCADSLDDSPLESDEDADADAAADNAGDDTAQAGDAALGKDTKSVAGATPAADAASGAPDRYYSSIDLVDAYHLQTILAYGLNDKPLPIANGAPLRARIERQLGYKMPKYLMRIALVDSYSSFGQGRGGYWEDQGYEWFAGI